jgi:hypothetical protein
LAARRDEEAKVALYESVTNQGIIVRKLRRMEEIPAANGEGPKSRVTETINGTCPGWIRLIVQKGARAHT